MSAAAAVTSAAHVVIDFAAGLYPTSLRGLLLVGLSAAALYVVWVIALVEMHKGRPTRYRLPRFFPCGRRALPTVLW